MLTALLMVDVAITWLFIEVYGTAYEQNPFMAPVLELPFGYAILAGLKMIVVLLVAGMSYRAYLGLHSEKHSEKEKAHAHKLEVWLWWFALGVAAVVVVVLMVNASML